MGRFKHNMYHVERKLVLLYHVMLRWLKMESHHKSKLPCMLTWNLHFQFSYVMTLFFCFHKKNIYIYIFVAILEVLFYKKM